jgi:Cys-tRNA(Pro)/Cys-tRNA(Cys) deacylase
MSSKTNAVRLLESKQIPFELKQYEVDETDLSAEHVAESMGIEPERIFKTLVLVNSEKQYLVAIIPGNAHLDLK